MEERLDPLRLIGFRGDHEMDAGFARAGLS
jgi:hypothetical protein